MTADRSVGTYPRAQHPAAPARERHQQRPPSIFAGGVDMQGPASLGFHGSTERRSFLSMERFPRDQEAPAEVADRSGRKPDAVVFLEPGADLVSLPVMHEALQTDVDQAIGSDHASRRNQTGQRCRTMDDPSPRVPASGGTDADGL